MPEPGVVRGLAPSAPSVWDAIVAEAASEKALRRVLQAMKELW